MSQAQRRLLIALKSPQQALADARPRCEDCGSVLVLADFHAYWDGPTAPRGSTSQATPRCCEKCAEEPG